MLNFHQMAMRASVKAAIIGAVGLIVAAAIGAMLQPSWWRPGPQPRTNLVIAGTVVDQSTNQAVGQAVLSVVGRTEKYVTEDNGNFRLELQLPVADGRVRIHATKNGYIPYDATVTPPTESLIVPLRKM